MSAAPSKTEPLRRRRLATHRDDGDHDPDQRCLSQRQRLARRPGDGHASAAATTRWRGRRIGALGDRRHLPLVRQAAGRDPHGRHLGHARTTAARRRSRPAPSRSHRSPRRPRSRLPPRSRRRRRSPRRRRRRSRRRRQADAQADPARHARADHRAANGAQPDAAAHAPPDPAADGRPSSCSRRRPRPRTRRQSRRPIRRRPPTLAGVPTVGPIAGDPTATPVVTPLLPSATPSERPSDPPQVAIVTGTDPGSGSSGGSAGGSNGPAGPGTTGHGGQPAAWGPVAAVLATPGLHGPTFPPLGLAPTLVTTTGAVDRGDGVRPVRSQAPRRRPAGRGRPRGGRGGRRRGHPAGRGLPGLGHRGRRPAASPASDRRATSPTMELLLPRWRRPSLLQARKADPIRDTTPAARLTFDAGPRRPARRSRAPAHPLPRRPPARLARRAARRRDRLPRPGRRGPAAREARRLLAGPEPGRPAGLDPQDDPRRGRRRTRSRAPDGPSRRCRSPPRPGRWASRRRQRRLRGLPRVAPPREA